MWQKEKDQTNMPEYYTYHSIACWVFRAVHVSICAEVVKWANIVPNLGTFIFRNSARPIPITFYPLWQNKIFSYTNSDVWVCQNKAKWGFGKYRVIHKSLRDFRLDCATTKTDSAERSISIGRESLKVFFVLGALAYFEVPPLGGSREEKWRSQWIRKRSVSWNLPKQSQLWLCNGGFGSCTTQNHLQTKQFVNGSWIPAEWLPVRCETNRPSGP